MHGCIILTLLVAAATVSAHHDREAYVVDGIKGSSSLDAGSKHHSHVHLGHHGHVDGDAIGRHHHHAAGLKLSSEGVAKSHHAADLGGMIGSILRYHQDLKNRMNMDFSGVGKSSVSGQGAGQLIGSAGGAAGGAAGGGYGSLLGSTVGSLGGKLNLGGQSSAKIEDNVASTGVINGIGSLLGRASGSGSLGGTININGRAGGVGGASGSVVASETGPVENIGGIIIRDGNGAAKFESRYENREFATPSVDYEMNYGKYDVDDDQEILVILDKSKREEAAAAATIEDSPEIERLIIVRESILEEPSHSSSSISEQRPAEQILTIEAIEEGEEGPKESSSVVVSVVPSSILEVSRVAGSSAISKPLRFGEAVAAGATSAAATGGADAKVNLGVNFNNNNDLHASIAEYSNNLKNSIKTKFGGNLDGGLNVKASGGGAGAGLLKLVV